MNAISRCRYLSRPRSVFARLTAVAVMLTMVANVSCTRTKNVPPVVKAPVASDDGRDKGWPRVYTIDGNEITLQQPQVDAWDNYATLHARLAVTVRLKDTEVPLNGIVEMVAATVTNHETRLVTLYKPEITAIRFPGAPPEMSPKLEAAVRSVPPAKEHMEIALDRVLAYVERGQAPDGVQVNLEPPPIFYSDRPAILISFLGEPRFSPIEGTSLEFGLNTNWDVLRDPKAGSVYLLYQGSWLTTSDVLKGSWMPAAELPADMSRLPKDEAWDRVRKSVPGQPVASMPRVFVSETPGEVIITDGRPKFAQIPGTNLAAVSNSENTVFYHQIDHQFYFLAAGRWFRAPDLNGPWTAATKTLPADFASIPKDNESAEILASVPGTQEANDAVFLASIPTTALVNRAEAQPKVVYDGDPKFGPIEKTTVQYAMNTANDVFLVGSKYYVCYDAVWFVGPSATGPWVVADSIPKEIYSIPATSPKHNVTYVYVYDSTPTTVTTGYTSGYNGEVIAAGIVMFGLGLIIANNYHHPHYYYGYYPPYCWGYGPRPMPYYGHHHYYAGPHGYGWSAHGPYGGAGYGARYNPSTGIYSRGGYAYGPGGGAAYRTGYNPRTGAYGGQRGGYNAYGSWKQSAVVKGDQWARGGRYSNSEGTAGWFQTSRGSAGVAYRGDNGSGYIVKGQNGNVYAGKDGNVYKRGENGEWSSANGSAASATSYQSKKAESGKQASATRGNGAASAAPANVATRGSSSKASTQPALSGGFGTPRSSVQSSASSGSSSSRNTASAPRADYSAGGSAGSVSSRNNAPSAGVQDSLNRDYEARQSGNERANHSSTGFSAASTASSSAAPGRSGAARTGGGRRR